MTDGHRETEQIKIKILERIADFKARAVYWQKRDNAGASELMKHCEARAIEGEAILQLFGEGHYD